MKAAFVKAPRRPAARRCLGGTAAPFPKRAARRAEGLQIAAQSLNFQPPCPAGGGGAPLDGGSASFFAVSLVARFILVTPVPPLWPAPRQRVSGRGHPTPDPGPAPRGLRRDCLTNERAVADRQRRPRSSRDTCARSRCQRRGTGRPAARSEKASEDNRLTINLICRAEEGHGMKGVLAWMIGIPIPIILILYLTNVF